MDASRSVYEIYIANGYSAGFWIRRGTWMNTCALVKSVGGRDSGELPGHPPNYADAAVLMDVYDLRTGWLKDSDTRLSRADERCYCRIDGPDWAAWLT